MTDRDALADAIAVYLAALEHGVYVPGAAPKQWMRRAAQGLADAICTTEKETPASAQRQP